VRGTLTNQPRVSLRRYVRTKSSRVVIITSGMRFHGKGEKNMQALAVRLIIFGIIVFVLYIKLGREFMKISNKKKALVLFAMSFMFGALQSIPFEAPFLKFNTPEQAFEYSYFNEKILKVIELSDSALVVYGDASELKFTIIPKSSNEWDYVNPANIQKSIAKSYDMKFIFSITNPNIGRTIIIVWDGFMKDPIRFQAVTDKDGIEFHKEVFKEVTFQDIDYYSVVYWQSIDSSKKKDYQVEIDGTLVKFK